MRITCPECGYSREIDESKIPAKSVKATCPKCQTKFRFRQEEPQFDIEPAEEQEAAAPTPEAAGEAMPSHAPETGERYLERREAEKEDATQANITEPEEEMQGLSSSDKPESEPKSRPRPRRIVMEDEPSDEDIWQRLENMGTGGEQSRQRTSFTEHEFPEDEPIQAEVPWERLDMYGFFGGLFQTIKRSMLAPGLFFEAMPIGRGLAMPLIFFLLVSEFQAICQLAWNYLGLDAMMRFGEQAAQAEPTTMAFGAGSLLILLIYPVLFSIWLFIISGILHGLLRIFGSGEAGYEGTFRVLAYSASPSVLAIIPMAGPIAGGFWSLVIMFIGLRTIHQTTFIRVFFAFILPMVIIIALAVSLTTGMQTGAAPNMY